ncbi:MAG: GDP-mannose 4,6-dehydratase [Ignavibacteriaceae bacterium]|jgi:UDP-glucose 4-epimerase
MNQILITGGAGFIGSHLSEYLLNKNYHVTILDNLSTGTIQNVEHLKKHNGFNIYIDDVRNNKLLNTLIHANDVIIHLAATVGVLNIINDPIQTIENNITSTEQVLKRASVMNKRVILASTSEVYGKSDVIPFSEDGDCLLGASVNSRWSYACTKLLDEFLALAYHKQKGLPITITRFFNTVGPRQSARYGMVIPNFVKQALRNDTITVFGNGQQKRCFCHVHDVISAIEQLIDQPESIGEIYNIGNDEEIAIYDLAKLVKRKCNSESEIKLISYNDAYQKGFEDMMRRVPSLTKINQLIKYKPKFNLDNILSDVISYESR